MPESTPAITESSTATDIATRDNTEDNLPAERTMPPLVDEVGWEYTVDLPSERVVDLVSRGDMYAADYTPEVRRKCVAYLIEQGYSSSDMAETLHCSERTIQRDRAHLRSQDAIAPSTELGDELLGELHRLTLASVQRLTRMAGDRHHPPYVRLWAEQTISKQYARFLDTAANLGYIDDARKRLESLSPQERVKLVREVRMLEVKQEEGIA